VKGIIGIIEKSSAGELDQMSRRLSHRGSAVLTTGEHFGIGQLCTSTGALPFYQNGIRIVSDARIDNQTEILEKIGVTGTEELSTHEFIFRAYSKLGIAFTEQLVGDFSITIIDETLGKLFLIRDHMGVRPLYYSFEQGVHFAFASEPKALLSLDVVSTALNPQKVEEYLQWPTDIRAYTKATIFQDIFSVIPATYLTINLDLNTAEETYYWKIDRERFRHLTTESSLIAAYYKAFEVAVRRRVKSVTGVHVSGGLDSSAVYKMAEKYLASDRLYSIHFYPGTPEADERGYAHEIIRDNLKNHHQIERNSDPLGDIRHSHASIYKPDLSTVPTGTKIIPELTFFQDQGVGVVLTATKEIQWLIQEEITFYNFW
jgi:asparagine synthase (glutamine-hydrolysing)